jgi:surfeit locus 1 family protein
MIRFRPLIVMTIFSVVALAVLISFGRWQWEKYEEKTAAADEPVAEMTIEQYQPIHDAVQFVHGVRPDTREQGWRVFVPVVFGDSVVFVAPLPLQRLWFAVDLSAMGRNGGLENVADYYIASSYVGADGRSVANPFALAPGADALPPARHLGYAITWYGLALVLIVIYFAYHVSVGRLSIRPPAPQEE